MFFVNHAMVIACKHMRQAAFVLSKCRCILDTSAFDLYERVGLYGKRIELESKRNEWLR